MKKNLIALAALAACGAAVGAGLGPQSYVQEGLVTQFDGIDNAGTGVHDPSAAKWIDLKGKASVTLEARPVLVPAGWIRERPPIPFRTCRAALCRIRLPMTFAST